MYNTMLIIHVNASRVCHFHERRLFNIGWLESVTVHSESKRLAKTV